VGGVDENELIWELSRKVDGLGAWLRQRLHEKFEVIWQINLEATTLKLSHLSMPSGVAFVCRAKSSTKNSRLAVSLLLL